ncbi:hypothetical protein HK405_004502 [Cladochytrium tenue]|nr:hypothetical protein HK405_004502 [Cladochytrium tenue]
MMAAGATATPEVLWAQRDNELYVTINVSDVESPKITLTAESLQFSGPSHGKTYEFKIEFFKEVDPAKQGEFQFWPRLIKSSTKPHFLKTDFARWKDEDDDEDEDPKGAFDMSQFTGMGGMGDLGGFGGANFDDDTPDDSDDEDLPELEAAPKEGEVEKEADVGADGK